MPEESGVLNQAFCFINLNMRYLLKLRLPATQILFKFLNVCGF
jgi:hypothetical protein